MSAGVTDPPLSDKVKFLLRSDSYPGPVDAVTSIETHMSWVFLAGDKAYKLKKAIQLPYLNFSTVEKREAACRAELVLKSAPGPNPVPLGCPYLQNANWISNWQRGANCRLAGCHEPRRRGPDARCEYT